MATTGVVVRASSMLQPDHGELNVPTGSIPREATVVQVPLDSHADGLREDNINEASASSQEPGVINQETSDQEVEILSKTELLNMMWMKMGLEGLTGVDGDNKHVLYKLALEQWEAKDKLFTTRVDRKTKQSLSVRNEIYQLVGFYSVFQGVLLTAVAQSNLLHCNNWWSAFTLSALASLVTVIGVNQKFDTILDLERTIGTETLARKVLYHCFIVTICVGALNPEPLLK